MPSAKWFLGSLVLGALGGTASGQSISPLLRHDDTVVGVGALDTISYIAINNNRLWAAQIDTTLSDTLRDGAVLRNGFVTLREGMTLFNPPGVKLDDWLSISINERGDLGMILTLLEADGDAKDGVFLNLAPVALQGDPIVAPGAPAGTVWNKPLIVKINSRNEMLVVGQTQNTITPPSRKDALIRYQLDSRGNVLGTTVLAIKDGPVPALGGTVNTLADGQHSLALNDKGDFIGFINSGSGATSRNAVLVNLTTIVAQERSPTPVAGTNWQTLSQAKVHINNKGDYAVQGNSDDRINRTLTIRGSKNVPAQKFAQQGDIIPTLSLAPIGINTNAPVILSDNGDLFWAALFSGANEDTYAKNYEVIVQENRTIIEGNPITNILADTNSFSVSPNGRFFAGRVEIQTIGAAIVYVDFGLVEELPGCAGNAGKLKLASGKPLVGNQMILTLDNGQAPGVIPAIAYALEVAGECGLPSPWGDVLITPGSVQYMEVLPPWNGTPTQVTLSVPNDLSLVDVEFYAQAAFRDPVRPSSEKYRLTNALHFELGPP